MVMLLTQLLLALHLLQYYSVAAHPLSLSKHLAKRGIVDVAGPHRDHWLTKRALLEGGKAAFVEVEESRVGLAAGGPHNSLPAGPDLPRPLTITSEDVGSNPLRPLITQPNGDQKPIGLEQQGTSHVNTGSEQHETAPPGQSQTATPPSEPPHAAPPSGSPPASPHGGSKASSSSEEIPDPHSPGTGKEEKDMKDPVEKEEQQQTNKEVSGTEANPPKDPEHKEEEAKVFQKTPGEQKGEKSSTNKGIWARIKESNPSAMLKRVGKWLITRVDRKTPEIPGGREIHPTETNTAHAGQEDSHSLKADEHNQNVDEHRTPKDGANQDEVSKNKENGGANDRVLQRDENHAPHSSGKPEGKDKPTKSFFQGIKSLFANLKEKIAKAFSKINFLKKTPKKETPTH